MDNYISKEYITEHISACWINGRPLYSPELDEVLSWIDEVPSEDVQPVRHGKWIQLIEYDIDSNAVFECSVCGGSDMHARGVDVPYCWHCGARMDKK